VLFPSVVGAQYCVGWRAVNSCIVIFVASEYLDSLEQYVLVAWAICLGSK
jgi:hypothetical protein